MLYLGLSATQLLNRGTSSWEFRMFALWVRGYGIRLCCTSPDTSYRWWCWMGSSGMSCRDIRSRPGVIHHADHFQTDGIKYSLWRPLSHDKILAILPHSWLPKNWCHMSSWHLGSGIPFYWHNPAHFQRVFESWWKCHPHNLAHLEILRWHGTSFSRLMPLTGRKADESSDSIGDGRGNSPDTSSSRGLWHMHGISKELVESPSRHKPQEHQKLKHWWESHGPPRSMTHRIGNHITDIYYSGPTKTIPLKEFVVCP